MTTYSITVPKLPKGLELSSKIRDAFAAAAQRHGVSAEIAQAIYSDVAGVAVTNFETQQAESSRQEADAISMLRDRFGPDFDRRMATARAAFEQLGLNEDVLALMEISGGAANAIERLALVGERLTTTSVPPVTSSSETPMQQNSRQRSLVEVDRQFERSRPTRISSNAIPTLSIL